MLTSVKIVNGTHEMVLLPRDGIRLQGLDAPFPEVRAVTEARADDDGERDTTALHGARACSVDVFVEENARAFEDEITRYLHPRVRPYLVVEDDEWSQARRLGLRSDQFSAPLGVDLPRRMRRVQVQWRVPDGVWEAEDLSSETVNADVPATDGVSFPLTLPFSFPATTAAGATTLTNLGAAPSHFVARMYGPCTDPSLINESTGEEITFGGGLVLASGDYVEVSTRDRTATLTLNGTASAVDRLNSLDWTVTSWWRVEPGMNQIRYAPAIASVPAAAVIEYRPAWL
jgi:tail protein